jgi:UvrD-like helicase C-terminal domain
MAWQHLPKVLINRPISNRQGCCTSSQNSGMLQRNLLYTGVTRGKRLVVLVGQKKAVAVVVRNVSGRRRWSKLAEWLSADISKRYVSA